MIAAYRWTRSPSRLRIGTRPVYSGSEGHKTAVCLFVCL